MTKKKKKKKFLAAHGRRARPESTYDPKAHNKDLKKTFYKPYSRQAQNNTSLHLQCCSSFI